MAEGYTDIPHNMSEILPYVIVDEEEIVKEILRRQKCCFYDTCSFQRHAKLDAKRAEYLLEYIKAQDGVIVVTSCILMELASHSGELKQEYIAYVRHIREFGISVVILYEEDLFSVMKAAFGTNAAVNSYLCWAVRMVKGPVSTITGTLEQNGGLCDAVIRGRNLEKRDVYKRFFEAVRANKESGDNLGEELLAVCLHILSHLPGEEDGKFCILTDDKGAAGKIDALFRETARQHKGRRIMLLSTPKFVQILHREAILEDRGDIEAILRTGTDGNIVVLGMRVYDIRRNEISTSSGELAGLILQPNGIHIIF